MASGKATGLKNPGEPRVISTSRSVTGNEVKIPLPFCSSNGVVDKAPR